MFYSMMTASSGVQLPLNMLNNSVRCC